MSTHPVRRPRPPTLASPGWGAPSRSRSPGAEHRRRSALWPAGWPPAPPSPCVFGASREADSTARRGSGEDFTLQMNRLRNWTPCPGPRAGGVGITSPTRGPLHTSLPAGPGTGWPHGQVSEQGGDIPGPQTRRPPPLVTSGAAGGEMTSHGLSSARRAGGVEKTCHLLIITELSLRSPGGSGTNPARRMATHQSSHSSESRPSAGSHIF